jgi:hypothetical protein
MKIKRTLIALALGLIPLLSINAAYATQPIGITVVCPAVQNFNYRNPQGQEVLCSDPRFNGAYCMGAYGGGGESFTGMVPYTVVKNTGATFESDGGSAGTVTCNYVDSKNNSVSVQAILTNVANPTSIVSNDCTTEPGQCAVGFVISLGSKK